MNPDCLLNDVQLAGLRRRLQSQLATAPAHALLSVTLDLGRERCDWLVGKLAQTHATWWAQPASADYRLALGRALIFTTAGPARFSALQSAFAGLAPGWLHDDSDATGAIPAAHIGFAFAEEERESREAPGELPNARLVVPAILLQSRAGRCSATFSCVAHDGEEAFAGWLETLRVARPEHEASAKAGVLHRLPAPLADRAFLARIRAALADIAAGRLDKVVTTRSIHLASTQPIALAPLLAVLARRHPTCTIYSIGHRGRSFVGATPERLVSLAGGQVRADALAGTAWFCTAAETPPAASLKLQDDKNSREQQLVVDTVYAALAPLCASLEAPSSAQVMQLRGLQHLHTRLSGRVHAGVGLFDLIARLHPTPAVGGAPTAAARRWLAAHGDQRGAWYTGGIGWIDRDGNGEIAVALRCARIDGARAELFAGAGIVAGSDPAQELAETEVKLGPVIDALQHAVPLAAPRATKTGTGTQ